MKFDVEHQFDTPVASVAALLVDPDFMTGVELPDVALPTVLAHERDEAHARLQLRYVYTGQVDALAKRVIGSTPLTWVQDLHLDLTAGTGALTMTAESMPDKFKARGDIAFHERDDGCVRSLHGEFSIRIPLVGGRAEKAILPGVLRRIDVEADAVRARLAL